MNLCSQACSWFFVIEYRFWLNAFHFQLKNFSEAEFRILCEHYGHTVPVHKRWYRLRDSTTELVKVSQMLMEADSREFGGNIRQVNRKDVKKVVQTTHEVAHTSRMEETMVDSSDDSRTPVSSTTKLRRTTKGEIFFKQKLTIAY